MVVWRKGAPRISSNHTLSYGHKFDRKDPQVQALVVLTY